MCIYTKYKHIINVILQKVNLHGYCVDICKVHIKVSDKSTFLISWDTDFRGILGNFWVLFLKKHV